MNRHIAAARGRRLTLARTLLTGQVSLDALARGYASAWARLSELAGCEAPRSLDARCKIVELAVELVGGAR